ncbi:hypothetical protein VRRI112168_02710 [Vreelandella rituensis]|uniref:Uncharacterized protein n=1 Tax=Vreelandella rituensis TaxID=2282306 RepID=A0A368U9M7_9GAMM|nr:hypothetical protein [Halomonas rituensis]RCV93655.1 hypothetical protein DU506_00430 [Halomonas rituensis]
MSIDFSADTIKTDLKDRMYQFLLARESHRQACAVYESLGLRRQGDAPSLFCYGFANDFEAVVNAYFADLCAKLTAEHAAGTPAEVSLCSDDYLPDRDALAARFESLATAVPPAQVTAFLNELDGLSYATIQADIEKQLAQLVDVGLGKMANRISSELGFWGYGDKGYKSGRFVTSISHPDYFDHGSVRSLTGADEALGKVAEASGMRFGQAIDTLARALFERRYGESIATRTVFGKGQPLEICCFKSKIELRWSREAFEAVQAFVTLHGGEREVDAVMQVAELDKAAA